MIRPQSTNPAFAFDDSLWEEAGALRRQYWGQTVFLRGIVEFSNHCKQNCLYCGLRRDNTALVRYRMDSDAVFRSARSVKSLGFGTVVLQSGEDPAWPAEDMADLVRRIKSELQLAVTLSLGEREESDYRLWREAGADRYLLKLETLDPSLYSLLRPGRQLEERLEALQRLQGLGYETGTGLIAGLPGENASGLENSIAALAEYAPDMVSISPFTPHPATPFGRHPGFGVPETLHCMALARIHMPESHIPVTSALGLHGDAVRLTALQVGNVLMPSLTPEDLREAYAIYEGKNVQNKMPEVRAAHMRDMLLEAGFTIGSGPGEAWRLSGASDLKRQRAQ